MDKNDFSLDYDPRREQDMAPDQYPQGSVDDNLDLDEFKQLIYGDDYGTDAGEAYNAGETEYNAEYKEDDLQFSDDLFEDRDLDAPAYVEPPKAEPQAQGLPGEDELLRRQPREENVPEEAYPQDPENYGDYDPQQEAYGEEEYPQEGEYSEGAYPQDGEYAEGDYQDQPYDEEQPYDENQAYEEKPRKEQKPKKQRKPIAFKKPSMPPFFKNFFGMYFGAAIAEFTGMNREQEGRRRRSKLRIFKDAYLPAIILLVAFVLVLSCIIGAASTLVQRKLVNNEEARKESIAVSEEADRLQEELAYVMDEANQAALEYDYEKAISILDGFSGEAPQELLTKRAEYATMSTKMVEWKDPTGIPNLSFHVLVADPARAYADKDLGGKYNQNFATTDEFQRILESLYANNYILVDFDSFVETSQGLDGPETFSIKPLLLPEDKKPVMITETLVSYYDYMVDSNDDGKPDAGGAGFAHRLVVDPNGDIKAEMVDKDGNIVVGDYDLVPILETFLKEHPDFSYRGSRAILAPSGEQGIFGYRIQTSVISDPKLGKEYYNDQVNQAKELVQVLRDKGYTMASYTYANRNYGQDNANQITEDLKSWDTQITPVIGNTNVIVFAQGGDIGDYTGTKYKALYEQGYRFFVGKADKPFLDVSNSYVRQKRLMVTGSNMFWDGKMFSGMFDTAAVLNSMRGDVPKAK